MCVCVCVCVDPGLFVSPLQQPPSIFITSYSDGRGKQGGEERSRRKGKFHCVQVKRGKIRRSGLCFRACCAWLYWSLRVIFFFFLLSSCTAGLQKQESDCKPEAINKKTHCCYYYQSFKRTICGALYGLGNNMQGDLTGKKEHLVVYNH